MDRDAKAGESAEAEIDRQTYRKLPFQRQVISTRRTCSAGLCTSLYHSFGPFGANLLSCCSVSGSISWRCSLGCSFWPLRALTTYTEMTMFTSLFFPNRSCISRLGFSSLVSMSLKTDQLQDN
jgi:hypothetical protein